MVMLAQQGGSNSLRGGKKKYGPKTKVRRIVSLDSVHRNCVPVAGSTLQTKEQFMFPCSLKPRDLIQVFSRTDLLCGFA